MLNVVKRLVKWIEIGFAIIAATGFLLFVGFTGYDRWKERPSTIRKLDEISLGDKLSDVSFRLGEFKEVPKGKDLSVKYPDEIDYENKTIGGKLGFSIHNGVVFTINYACNDNGSNYIRINGIECGSDGDRVLDRFKDNVRVLCSNAVKYDDSYRFVRVYDVVEYGVRYMLVKNRVEGFIVADKDELKSFIGINWVPCS